MIYLLIVAQLTGESKQLRVHCMSPFRDKGPLKKNFIRTLVMVLPLDKFLKGRRRWVIYEPTLLQTNVYSAKQIF